MYPTGLTNNLSLTILGFSSLFAVLFLLFFITSMYAHFSTIPVIIIYSYEDTHILRRLVLIVL